MPLRPSRGKRRLRPQLEESSTPIWLTPRRSDASLARPYNPSKIFMPRTSLFSLLATLAAVLVVMAAPAQAEAIKGFFFKLKRGTPVVEGIYAVGGYTAAEMVSMMGKYCAGGKIGQIAHVGKARKRRGQILQKFQTTCAGGMPQRFKGSTVGIEIEYITQGEYAGQHLVEITGSDGLGNMIYTRETIRP